MNSYSKWTKILALTIVAIALASCQSTGQSVAAIGAGVAGLGAVFQELTNAGVMSPVQHLQAQHALEAIAATVSATQQAAQLAQQTAEAAKAGGVNATEFATGLAGTAATVGVAVNSWRNLTRGKALAKAKVA